MDTQTTFETAEPIKVNAVDETTAVENVEATPEIPEVEAEIVNPAEEKVE
jgi:cell division ATPase FtsA